METTKPQTRQQRRINERINDQVSEVSTVLGERFLKFFTTCADPEGKEVTAMIDQIDRQWRTFCSQKRLIPKAYPHMREYMFSVVNEYLQMKEPVETSVENVEVNK